MAWDILPVLNASPESDNDDDDPDLSLKIIMKNGTVIVVKVVGLQMKKLKYLRND